MSLRALGVFLPLLCACRGGGVILGSIDGAVDIEGTAGSMPSQLPNRLLVGFNSQSGDTWAKDSGQPWDIRALYLAKGWVDDFGFGASDGGFALTFLTDSASQNTIPALGFGQLSGEAGSDLLSKVQSATTMASYFADFKLLMQVVKGFGKPTIVFVENDSFGVLEIAANHDPNQGAAVASSGLPELVGLPDTLAGWGQAFVALRESVGASNVVLAIDVAAYASGKDLLFTNPDVPLDPEVEKAWAYLGPSGIMANATGASYDLLAHRVQLLDCDCSRLRNNESRCLDPDDTASTLSLSYNRLIEWMRLWNHRSGKRWALWNVSLGNSNHLNVPNTGQASEGYKDNTVEYLFGSYGSEHRAGMLSACLALLVFGPVASDQSSYVNDVYTDGQLFFKTRVGAFLAQGSASLP